MNYNKTIHFNHYLIFLLLLSDYVYVVVGPYTKLYYN